MELNISFLMLIPSPPTHTHMHTSMHTINICYSMCCIYSVDRYTFRKRKKVHMVASIPVLPHEVCKNSLL